MKWDKVRLGDIMDLQNGFAFNSDDYVDSSNVYNCRMSNIRPGGDFDIDYNPRFLPNDYADKYSQFLLKKGDIIVAMTDLANDPKILGVPTIVNTDKTILLNQRVGKLIIKNNERVFIPFLKYALNRKEVQKYFGKFSSGGLQINLGKNDLLSYDLPLPPLPIQKRIAQILDAADALKRKDQQLLKKYDELAQAIFIDMFGDPVKNEKGWDVKKVIDYCNCIVPGRDKPKSFTGTTPWVTTDDLIHLGITKSSKKALGLTTEEIEQVNAKVIPAKSVIMTCVGDLGIISINDSDIVINQQLHAFQCGLDMNPEFLMFNLSKQKDYMYKMASSTTVPYMNKTVCNSIPVICPPKSLQESFSQKIDYLRKQLDILKNIPSNNLFNSLIQKAFNGQLIHE